jgi:predicted dehydrogenase
MTKNVRIGIVGLGGIGTVHANAFKALGPSVEVTAISDIDPAKLAALGEKFPAATRCQDYRELVKGDLDGVVVAVGNAFHKDVAVAALRAGKATLVEKPMAMNSREADAIQGASLKSGAVLQIGMVRRQMPAVRVVKEYVDSGFFGEIYHIRAVLIRRRGIPGLGGWFTTRADSGGGPMIDVGVHLFDQAMWMSGLWNPTRVSASTYAKFGPRMGDYRYVGMWAGPPKLDGKFDVEDYSTGFVRFGSNATMSFEIAWAANVEDQSYIELLGDKAGTRITDGKSVTLFTEHEKRPADISPQFDANANLFECQARSFVAAIRGEQPPAATGAEGVTLMKLIDAIYASSERGVEIRIANGKP